MLYSFLKPVFFEYLLFTGHYCRFYCRAFLVVQLVENLPAMLETWVRSLGWEDSSGEGKGYPLQYSGLENSMDVIVHGVTKSWT